MKDKNVLMVEDMIDSGLTLHYIMRSLSLRRPRSLEVCTLFDRPHQRLVDMDVRYRGFEVPDDFFVGYGFDYRQSFRNLPYVAYLQLGPTSPRSSRTPTRDAGRERCEGEDGAEYGVRTRDIQLGKLALYQLS